MNHTLENRQLPLVRARLPHPIARISNRWTFEYCIHQFAGTKARLSRSRFMPTSWSLRGHRPARPATAGRESHQLALALVTFLSVDPLASLNPPGHRGQIGSERRSKCALAAPRSAGSDLLNSSDPFRHLSLEVSRRIESSSPCAYKTPIKLPRDALAKKLKQIAQLIDADGHAGVLLSLDGFDTAFDQAALTLGCCSSLAARSQPSLRTCKLPTSSLGLGRSSSANRSAASRRTPAANRYEGSAAPVFLSAFRVQIRPDWRASASRSLSGRLF